MKHPVTMAVVAKTAGVHQTTVSLALRNHRSIPEKTAARIRKIADDLGYRPNPMVSALIAERRRGRPSGQGSILAFLTCFPQRNGWRHSPNYVAVHEELKAHAAHRGYRVEEFWLAEPGMTPARMRDILLSRGIRGLIVCPMPSQPRTLDFDFSGFAVLALGLTLEAPLVDRVAIDYHAVMSLCVNRLKARGRRRISFATTLEIDSRVNHLSLGAFLAERHLEPRRFVSPFTADKWTRTEIIAWLKATRPDAVITAITPHYLELKKWLPIVDAPELTCVDCAVNDPTQTGVVQNLAGEARAAVDLLTSRVERAQFGVPAEPQVVLVAGTWRD